MDKSVYYLRRWLLKHNIDPKKVRLKIETDPRTSCEIECALMRDWDRTQGLAPQNYRDMKLFDISVSLTPLS